MREFRGFGLNETPNRVDSENQSLYGCVRTQDDLLHTLSFCSRIGRQMSGIQMKQKDPKSRFQIFQLDVKFYESNSL